jgi:hypothetical protein
VQILERVESDRRQPALERVDGTEGARSSALGLRLTQALKLKLKPSLVEPGSRTRTSASGVAVFRGLKSLLAESLVESLGTLVVRMAFEAVRNLT